MSTALGAAGATEPISGGCAASSTTLGAAPASPASDALGAAVLATSSSTIRAPVWVLKTIPSSVVNRGASIENLPLGLLSKSLMFLISASSVSASFSVASLASPLVLISSLTLRLVLMYLMVFRVTAMASIGKPIAVPVSAFFARFSHSSSSSFARRSVAIWLLMPNCSSSISTRFASSGSKATASVIAPAAIPPPMVENALILANLLTPSIPVTNCEIPWVTEPAVVSRSLPKTVTVSSLFCIIWLFFWTCKSAAACSVLTSCICSAVPSPSSAICSALIYSCAPCVPAMSPINWAVSTPAWTTPSTSPLNISMPKPSSGSSGSSGFGGVYWSYVSFKMATEEPNPYFLSKPFVWVGLAVSHSLAFATS